jgi:hypothetical protein
MQLLCTSIKDRALILEHSKYNSFISVVDSKVSMFEVMCQLKLQYVTFVLEF